MSNRDQDLQRHSNSSAQPSSSPPSPPPVKVKVLVSSKPSRRDSPRLEPPPTAANIRVLVSDRARSKSPKPNRGNLDSATSPVSSSTEVKVLVSDRAPEPSFPELEEWEEELEDDRRPIRILAASKPRRSNPAIAMLWFTLSWAGIAALVIGGGWLAIQLIVNPGSIPWMGWMFPESVRGALEAEGTPRSLKQIREQAEAAGLYLGQPFSLGDSGDLVIPVSTQMAPCSGLEATPSAACGEISELRLYRPFRAASQRQLTYELIDRLAVPGLEEYFVVAPLTITTGNEGSSRRLPFTTVSAIAGSTPSSGIWLQVSGERLRDNTRVVFGQVMGYNPQRGRLETRLQWTSPTADLPRWQSVIDGGMPELVINQTVGLEPDFKIYQIHSATASTLELKPISLTPVLTNATYKNGLLLAESGLWSPALQMLQRVKDRSRNTPSEWSATAQAQLDLVRYHAEFTQAQAKRVWANPSQQITALLIDGQWATALQQFRAALKEGRDLTSLLRDDSKVLWRRVEAALKVNRRNYDVQAWGALTIATQQGRRAAIAWLQSLQPSQTPNAPVDPQLQDILRLLSLIPRGDVPISQSGRFLGFATPMATINPREWTVAESDVQLERGDNQTWYRVQINRFQVGQRWWRSPFNTLNLPALGATHQLWEDLGLAANSQFQLVFWSAEGQFQTVPVTAKAIRFNNGTLQLLAIADELPQSNNSPSQPLAMASETLQWLESSYTLTLNDLTQQQPGWMSIVLPTVWQELQEDGYLTTDKTPTSEEMLQEIGSWVVELVDFTGNNQPEIRLTIQPASLVTSTYVAPEAVDELESAPSHTMIFLDGGRLIYNEMGSHRGQRILAIATLADDPLPLLLLTTGQRYEMHQWSSQNQQFQ